MAVCGMPAVQEWVKLGEAIQAVQPAGRCGCQHAAGKAYCRAGLRAAP